MQQQSCHVLLIKKKQRSFPYVILASALYIILNYQIHREDLLPRNFICVTQSHLACSWGDLGCSLTCVYNGSGPVSRKLTEFRCLKTTSVDLTPFQIGQFHLFGFQFFPNSQFVYVCFSGDSVVIIPVDTLTSTKQCTSQVKSSVALPLKKIK